MQRDFLLINDLEEELPNHELAQVSWTILLLISGLAVLNVTSMLNELLFGAALMVAGCCCTITQAKRSLNLMVKIMIAASFALGAALQKTGAAGFIANQILAVADGNAWLFLRCAIVWV